ncbi:uncharacterized protein GGS25DRAFT_195915 [Hypoxylon fragiforme]|uniref:uncharacterized protein n=1 Tax=Hypoxylon fragiforme TaxID=63214 RepID=UPI0020C5C60E|nr:uncharacterized protein GGS25DRAFT_195915 [Hypoxylon fragiforme]KAI2611433.1 hypothetical protein GGS25DRAFT_195915 [Hypoxylon fragiforme]
MIIMASFTDITCTPYNPRGIRLVPAAASSHVAYRSAYHRIRSIHSQRREQYQSWQQLEEDQAQPHGRSPFLESVTSKASSEGSDKPAHEEGKAGYHAYHRDLPAHDADDNDLEIEIEYNIWLLMYPIIEACARKPGIIRIMNPPDSWEGLEFMDSDYSLGEGPGVKYPGTTVLVLVRKPRQAYMKLTEFWAREIKPTKDFVQKPLNTRDGTRLIDHTSVHRWAMGINENRAFDAFTDGRLDTKPIPYPDPRPRPHVRLCPCRFCR